MSEHRISVCIVCRNEADRLAPCLASVAWADEVIVMDLESEDDSADVAARHGARVIERSPLPIVEPLREELAAAASGEWVLAMDPDERVSTGLAAALREASVRDDVDAVEIPFTHFDFGYPPTHRLHRFEPRPRMYRRGVVEWPSEPNKHPVIAAGRTLRLPDSDDLVMIHDRNRSVVEALDRVIRYAPAEAQAMIDRGEVFTARRMFATLEERPASSTSMASRGWTGSRASCARPSSSLFTSTSGRASGSSRDRRRQPTTTPTSCG